jgi:hypothetical protein
LAKFANHRWSLTAVSDDRINPARLVDLETSLAVADADYCYDMTVSPTSADVAPDTAVFQTHGVQLLDSEQTVVDNGATQLLLRGRLDFGPDGPQDITIEHVFRLPATDSWIDEEITIATAGDVAYDVKHLRFGFRKTIYDRQQQQWVDGGDRRFIASLPHRRRWGQATDHLASTYAMGDLMPLNWSGQQLPGRGAEAWYWGDSRAGYLIAKHCPERIEFSVVDGDVGESTGAEAFRSDSNFHFRFGGAGRYLLCPEALARLGPGVRVTLGVTRIYPVDGGWEEAAATYKTFLGEKGHGLSPTFDPPVHWNELYNLGWRLGEGSSLQTPEQLREEAALARDLGAEAFYFDPGWDLFEGSSVWDEARLGPLTDFVATMRDDHGLKTSLHLMMHTMSVDEDPRIYRRRQDGSIDIWGNENCEGGRICAASESWQQMKIDRLLTLADAGVTFFMFDFNDYVAPGVGPPFARHVNSACWARDHGHDVPLTMQAHAEGVLNVIQAVKQRYPHVLIEAHDRITAGMQDFHPCYFQHSLRHSFDENWGFEYMWDPYLDLLSGKALSLYEYNLSYDIPLYLHINCGKDNQQMLAFWWYASTCRHLGIGGVRAGGPLYGALKQAMATYLELKPFFCRGRFVGVDPMAHGHVLDDRRAAVFVLFNLGSEPVQRRVPLRSEVLGFEPKSSDAVNITSNGKDATLIAELPPLTPTLVRVGD